MAVVTSDFLAGVLTNFRATFQSSFDAARNLASWRDVALEFDSQSLVENHSWLGTVPVAVDVTHGDLQLEGLFSFNYSISNLTFKVPLEVQRAVFEDDRLGMLAPRVAQLGEEAAAHPGRLVLQLPVDNGLAFDGVAFFADTRVIGRSANIDNTLAQTGVTIANIQTDIGLVRRALRLFQDDQGRPMNNVMNVIMCEPGIEQAMYQALSVSFPDAAPTVAGVIPADAAVRTINGYTLIANPYITNASEWYGFAVTPTMKPFFWQTRIRPSLEGTTDPNTESGTIRDRFVYTARYRGAPGYGDPRYAVRVT